MLVTVSTAFDKISTDVRARKVALRNNYAIWYWPSSHCMLTVYGPSAGSAWGCSFADVSIFSVLLKLVFACVELSSCVGHSIHELLRVSSDVTSSNRRSISAKVTICLSFAVNFRHWWSGGRIRACYIGWRTLLLRGRSTGSGCERLQIIRCWITASCLGASFLSVWSGSSKPSKEYW